MSNAYIPKEFGGGGKWHGVDYLKEVLRAEYEHLALVPNPRYEESIILTPEEFQAYNLKKESELKKVANSLKQGAKAMFNFFKKTKVDNASDFEALSVVLPKSGKEMTIAQIVNEMDEHHMKKHDDAMKHDAKHHDDDAEHPMAHPDHHVMVGKEKIGRAHV